MSGAASRRAFLAALVPLAAASRAPRAAAPSAPRGSNRRGRLALAGSERALDELVARPETLGLDSLPETLRIHLGSGAPPGALALSESGSGADDPAAAAAIETGDCTRRLVRLSGGHPAAWRRALYPRGRASRVALALLRAHHAGAHLAAAGRAAETLCAATLVRRAELDPPRSRSHNPRTRGEPVLWWGLGLFPWAFVRAETERPEAYAEFVRAAWRERMRLALWIPGAAAAVADVPARRFHSEGSRPLVVWDLRGARRSPDWLLGARVGELPRHGIWSDETRRVQGGTPVTETGPARHEPVPDVLQALPRAMADLAGPLPPRRLELRDPSATLTLVCDEATRRLTGTGRSHLVRVRADLSVRGA